MLSMAVLSGGRITERQSLKKNKNDVPLPALTCLRALDQNRHVKQANPHFDTESSLNFCRSELQSMSVNAQVLRLKKQLEDAERKQKESEKVLLHLVTRTKITAK